ncbi:HNH endonuclease [Ruminococcus sp.]|uniref:HNH endonuclease n=1 Tax=Ruminococcus sp. TaxID=41978 RepID=UPI0025E81E2A|nr:HNH endonuclease [Ruminococcus sp.]
MDENYVCKKEVDWSLLNEGLTLPQDNQVVFGQVMGRFLRRGESKEITLYLDNKSYKAKIVNVNNPIEKRKKDAYQIRYTKNGELAQALQKCFFKSYQYIKTAREKRSKDDRSIVKLPDEYKEYLVIYTTVYDDTYILESIKTDELQILKNNITTKDERYIEDLFNNDIDDRAGLFNGISKIRKLNRKIGDNLKLLYGFRCQICGELVGENYGTKIAEAHHIDYFSISLNNNSNNQLVLCPNHHRIIHKLNPIFNRENLSYSFPDGYNERLKINLHLYY